ncbi:DctP family TRAP transporter solute-binding subunit [Oceanobacillus polygoni]|uniref:Tripartite ATP-independent transporter DctP family solute receptor n=1 Tax=Oceanobacillus polygoni TaxID=1235259 RepID=A0A9X1CLK3_9BACI|nr:DctP family TRAP transporter solute-binding subunit [Oceanobacillus polygoni]MBP2079902.1 tripartite ATP-independent transporter DctP family solute receptor [Oceanobacillus polygoni]
MNNIFKIALFSVILALVLIGCDDSESESVEAQTSVDGYEETTIRLAYNLPPDHHISLGVEEFAKNIIEKSDGQVNVQVYPNGQLLTDKDMNQSVLTGGIEMGVNSSTMWAATVPAMGIFDVPYIFDNYEEAGEALNGEFGDKLRSEMEERGARVLMFADYGYAQFANNVKPVESPEDFQGLKFRSMGNLPSELIKAYGASPVFMGGGEVYMALQRNTVDGATSGTTAMVQRNYNEVVNYLTVNNYAYLEFVLAVNNEFWEELPEKTQTLIEVEVMKTEEWIRQQAKIEDERTKNELVERGMELYEISEEEIPIWREAAMPVWDVFVDQAGEVGQELLDIVNVE